MANIHTPSQLPVMVHTELYNDRDILRIDGSDLWRYLSATRFEAATIFTTCCTVKHAQARLHPLLKTLTAREVLNRRKLLEIRR